jgi:hypothetical protein
MDREKVIKGLNDIGGFIAGRVGFEQARNFLRTIDDALALLKEQEAKIEQLNRFVNGFSRDAIPVVRCKDCKYYDYFNGCMSWHDVNSNNDNWYCADGERRTDDA